MSYLVINRDIMEIVAHVEKSDIASMIEAIYYKEVPTVKIDLGVNSSWSQLERLEAVMLLKRHMEIVEDPTNYPAVLQALIALGQNFPLTNVNVQSLEYAAGIMRDKVLQPPSTPFVSDDKPHREPSISAPSPKGATGRVWEIAEGLLTTVGSSDMKALRTAVIQACQAAGIHEATAATQWSKWKKSKGL